MATRKRFRDTKTGEFVSRMFAFRKPKVRTVAEAVNPDNGNVPGRGRIVDTNELAGVTSTAADLAARAAGDLVTASLPGRDGYPLRSGEAAFRSTTVGRNGMAVVVSVRIHAARKEG